MQFENWCIHAYISGARRALTLSARQIDGAERRDENQRQMQHDGWGEKKQLRKWQLKNNSCNPRHCFFATWQCVGNHMHVHIPNGSWMCQSFSFEISLIDLANLWSKVFFQTLGTFCQPASVWVHQTAIVMVFIDLVFFYFFYQDRMVIFTLRDEQSTAPGAFLCGEYVFCFILDRL